MIENQIFFSGGKRLNVPLATVTDCFGLVFLVLPSLVHEFHSAILKHHQLIHKQ